MPFDFTTYLQDHLSARRGSDQAAATGDAPFTVEVLTGGLMNHTARVRFASPLLVIDGIKLENGDGIHSAILKHAPPYIAAAPNQPMSVDRQLTEKKALQIFSGDDSTFPPVQAAVIQALVDRYRQMGTIGTSASVRINIPRYIWHDAKNNVIWIEDLGQMKTLSQILLQDSDPALETTHIQEFAAVLGRFLSELFQATANPPEPWITHATSTDSLSLYHYLTGLVLKNCREFGDITEAEAVVLSERAGRALRAKAEAEDVCLGMVDFWPGNILVELGAFGRCGLIDWEYFRLTSASSELGMLLAHLHVHLLNTPSSATATQSNLRLFAKSTFRAYAQSQPQQVASNGFKRALLISHGREMVNSVSQYEEDLTKESKRKVVAAGVRSLRAAGESKDDIDLTGLRPLYLGEDTDVHVIWETLGVFGFA
ncbi:hypothetical protein M413DRAFT_123435 [Hebeloma cylindrosporum]|uniref:Aminoglycoside phosphotransferase domain-containing protein n=1 Tax=Hebeloma cylindrosporum TaxID=76867 RepID=A0A0C2YP13_HEBCY|nr:hypothetical protein M413DRAFT_123435 [Hebeloma cylindrosporum h7]